MNAPVIPARVIEFLAENIETVPQLEAMLLLWQAPNSRWSVEELAVRLYVSKEKAAAIIRAQQMRALIVSDGQPNACRYSTDWHTSGTLMAEVDHAYRHHLVDIIRRDREQESRTGIHVTRLMSHAAQRARDRRRPHDDALLAALRRVKCRRYGGRRINEILSLISIHLPQSRACSIAKPE